MKTQYWIYFSNKFPLYFYPKYDYYYELKDNNEVCVGIKMIELEGNRKKVIMKYNNKEYYYSHVGYLFCCGGGTDSFIQLDNKEDMEYFDYDGFEKDEKMQKHFEYLRSKKNWKNNLFRT